MTRRIGAFFGGIFLAAQLLAGEAEKRADWTGPQVASVASGLGINLTVVGRLIGSGNTLFLTDVDVTNNTAAAAQIDFYFDGTSAGIPVDANGSISSAGAIVPQGTGGTVRGHANVHFTDFVDALVKAGLIPASVETDGVLGSALFVFNGFSKSGQAAVTARFYNSACGGTVGQAINGREITTNEPTKLVVTARNTVGKTSPALYTNLFINNTGLTPTGSGSPSAVDVLVSAFSNSTGAPIGTPLKIADINPGAVAVIGVFPQLAIPSTEDTVILTINVTSGTSAIDAVAVAIDNTTHDGTTTKAASGAF